VAATYAIVVSGNLKEAALKRASDAEQPDESHRAVPPGYKSMMTACQKDAQSL
jgi:hypothetical protein